MMGADIRSPQIPAGTPGDVAAWLESLPSDRPDSELDLIRRAAEFAQDAHRGQTRASGEPYVTHSLAVADILASLRLDHESIVAAILHDVVEDTPTTLEDIQQQFGDDVARLVDGVTKMKMIHGMRDAPETERRETAHAESLRKMLLAMAEDVRVVLIKLADRLHNMRTLGSLSTAKQQRIARETMEIYAPLANRLGIWQIKWELEDLSFRYLQPQTYRQIAAFLAERRDDRVGYIDRFVERLQHELDRAEIPAEVSGRAKHIYGIWKKMQRKRQDFHQIHDIHAVRVFVDRIRDCYAALGIVHSLWQYLPGEFDDYIATPKENNYRSIHTAVIGPQGKIVEVQIRTHEMHRESEYGVAAHWRYKEGARTDADFDSKIAWLRQLLEWKDEVAEASDFVDQFKSAVFSDRVYVFTPRGNVIDLPRGSTPLDFAYHIHTEVGHRCRGAKVNGHIVPLTYNLNTGEQVEILTVRKGGPSRDWLNPHLAYLKTSKARAQVQRWFRLQNHDHNVSDGRAILERELKRLGFTEINYEKLAQRFGHNKQDEFLAAIGRGDVRPARLVTTAQEMSESRARETTTEPQLRAPQSRTLPTGVSVNGVGDLLTRFAGCCKPLPGDPIVGFITRGAGISIHRQDCHNALRAVAESPERLIEVDWGNEAGGTYPVDVAIQAFDRRGLLRDITTLLANEGVNVTAVNTLSHQKSHTADMILTVEIPDIDALSRIIARIGQLPNVTDIRRKTR
jgi:GTP pyrophosphokinase